MRSRSAASVTSARMANAAGPSDSAALRSVTSLRPVMATCAPSSTNRRAVASPMPLLPPVMSANLPSSLPILAAPGVWSRGIGYQDIRAQTFGGGKPPLQSSRGSRCYFNARTAARVGTPVASRCPGSAPLWAALRMFPPLASGDDRLSFDRISTDIARSVHGLNDIVVDLAGRNGGVGIGGCIHRSSGNLRVWAAARVGAQNVPGGDGNAIGL